MNLVSPPVVSGTVAIGNTLSTNNGTWSANPAISSYTYQWRRGGVDISGATSSSYTITSADYGNTLDACVTASNGEPAPTSPKTNCSSATVAVPALAPSNTGLPSISGVVKAKNTLTGAAGSWSGVPNPSLSYQWRKCDSAGNNCQDIPGQTGTSYTLTYDDVGATIRFQVTASNVAGSVPATSLATAAVGADNEIPSNTSLPTISGTTNVGNDLTGGVGGWNGYPRPTYAYQWQRCDSGGNSCSDISGATQSTYSLVSADREKTIRLVVTASNSLGSASATSAASSVVNAAPSNIALPTISGTSAVGQTLSGNNGSWDGFPTPTYSYQWQRCDSSGANCNDIAGATTINRTIVSADAGQTLRLGVTAQNTAGSLTRYSQVSEPTSSSPAISANPTTYGRPEVGSILTASVGTWNAYPVDLTYSYQWQRCDANGNNCQNIAGATSGTYTIQSADNGSTIRVQITAANSLGQSTTTSSVTPVMQSAGGGWTSVYTGYNNIDVAVDSQGNVYTANYCSNNVGKITLSGSYSVIGSTGSCNRAITVDSQGNVYTADQNSNAVTKLTWNGSSYSSSTLAGTGNSPMDIVLDSQNNVYTSNQGSNNVSKITTGGSSSIIGSVGANPYGVAVDAQDNIYASSYTNSTASKLTPSGSSYSVSTIGNTGANPVGIGVDRDGNVYTANYSSNTVSKFTPSGSSYNASPSWGSTGSSPLPLALDRVGNVYTANFGSSNISRLSRAAVLTTPGSTGSGPYGIALDERRGYGYTANYSSATVTRFTLPMPPGLSLERLSATPTKNNPIQFTFSSERALNYSTISSSDFAITNGTWSSISPTSNASSYTINVTPTTQGPVTIAPSSSFSVLDINGVEQTEIIGGGSRRVVFDSVAPTVQSLTKTSPAASVTNATTISYAISFSESVGGTFAASDIGKAGSSTWLFNAQNVQGSGANYTFDLVRSGSVGDGGTVRPTITAGSVQDAATNTGPASLYSGPDITVDYSAPLGGSLNPPAWSTSGTFNLNVTNYSDPESSIQTQTIERRVGTLSGNTCSAYGSWQTTSADQSTLSTGCYEFRLRATNTLGMESIFTVSSPTKVDRTAPTGGALSPPAWSTDGTVNLNIANFADAESGIQGQTLERRSATLSGNTCSGWGSWATTTTSQTGLGTGCYEYRLQATNNAGDSTTLGASTKVDLTAPEGGTLSSPAWSTDGTFTLNTTNYADPESGIASQALERRVGTLSGNACSAYGAWQTTVASQTGLTTGCYEYRLSATSNAGVSRTLTSTTKVDRTGPEGGSLAGPEWSTESAFNLNVTNYTDSQSGISSQVLERSSGTLANGVCSGYGSWGTTTSSQTGLSTGCYQYRLVATSNSSLQSTSQITVKVDLSPPSGGSITAPEWNQGGSFSINAVPYSDDHSGMLFNKLERRMAALSQGVCGGDWGVWEDTPAGQLITSSGCYQYRLTGKNAAGVEASTFATTRVDADPPQGGQISSPEWSETGTFTVSTTPYSDPQSGIVSSALERRSGTLSEGTCSSYGSWQAATTSQNDLQSGCYQYRLSATSGTGEFVSVTSTTKVDRTPPEGGQITAPEWSSSGTFTLSVSSVSDPDSGIASSVLERRSASIVDGVCQSWGNYSSTTTSQSSLATNCYQYRSIVRSGAGNEQIYLATTKVDRSDPTAASVTPSNATGNTWIDNKNVFYANLAGYSGSFRVTASASDTHSGLASALFPTAASMGALSGGGEEVTSPYNTTYQWSGPSNLLPGAKQVRIYNRAGLFASDSFTVIADSTAPSINWNACQGTAGENGWLVSPATCSYSIADPASGIASSEKAISVDGGAYNASSASLQGSASSSTASFTLDNQGVIDMRSRGIDRVGIESSWQDGPRIKIDTVSPVDQTVIEDAYKDSFVLDIQASDATSGYNSSASTCQRRDASGSVVTSIPCNTEILKNESIRYTIYDFAGNSRTSSWITPVVDTTEPTVQVTGVSQTCPEGSGSCTTDWSSDNVTLTIQATDGDSPHFGIDRIEVADVKYEGYENQDIGQLADLQIGGDTNGALFTSQVANNNWYHECRPGGGPYPDTCTATVTLSKEGWRKLRFRAIGEADSKNTRGAQWSPFVEVKIDKTPPRFVQRLSAQPNKIWKGAVQVASTYEDPPLNVEASSGTITQPGSGASEAKLMYCSYENGNCRRQAAWKTIDFGVDLSAGGQEIPKCGDLGLQLANGGSQETLRCAFAAGSLQPGTWLISGKLFDVAQNESYIPSKNGALMAGKNDEGYLRGITRLSSFTDFCPIEESN